MSFVPALITLGSSFLATQGFTLGSLRDAHRPRAVTLGSSFLATQGFNLGSLRDALRPRADYPRVARSSQPRASIWAPFGMPLVPALITLGSSFLAILGFKLGSLRDALRPRADHPG